MKYFNIDRKLNEVPSDYQKFSSQSLLYFFDKTLLDSGFDIIKINNKNPNPYVISIRDMRTLKEYDLVVIIKNITGSGWRDKPRIKRIQVGNTNDYIETIKSQFDFENPIFLLIGYYNHDQNPIYVSWDYYRYDDHETLRSCYINNDTLIRGYNLNYFETVNANQKVWVFEGEVFEKFFKSYLKYQKSRENIK